MEMFETIWREYAAGGTVKGLARKHGVQRRMMRQAPRKQRHTAHRIWTRLRPGYSAHAVGEPTVRGYDRVSMPRSYGLGQEAQVDWCEAQAEPDGQAHQARNLEMFEIVKEVILYQRLELFCRNTPDLSHRENACACVNL
ncbi:MAG: hypothetical protein ACK5YZ_01310 [bacterium]|jgi:hypothetical protein